MNTRISVALGSAWSRSRRSVKIPLQPGYLVAFFCLTFALGQLHEISHHVVGRLTCGAWGRADLMSFSLAEGCSYDNGNHVILASIAGPLTNYLLMILGAALILRSRHQLVGFCLVLGALPAGRLLTLYTYGDEHIFGKHLFGASGPQIVTAIALAVMLPSLTIAWRSIANERPWLWFTGFLIGPIVLVGPMVAMINPMLQQGRTGYIAGLPWPLVVANAIAASAVLFLRSRFVPARSSVQAPPA